MATVVLDAYAKAYPSITNRIRASVFLETDPASLIATIIDTTAGHPARIYHFPGLPRANYGFSLDEIDGADNPIQNLALFSVVPGQIDGLLSRDDEQIQVGVTPGIVVGATSATFDGTAGAPNYIGWEIVPSELTGRGIMVEGLDYSWDKVTGIFSLLQPGDIFQINQWYNIHFNPIVNPAGGSVPSINDFTTRVITATGNIQLSDFGNNIILEPAGVYMELTLPDITTVPQGRILTIESKVGLGTALQCTRILPFGADVIRFLRGNLYIMNNESLQIYRLRRADLSNEWRVRYADGNFKTVGQSVPDDQIQTGVFCKQLLDGSIKDKFQYARIYNEFVLNLPAGQLVDFDAWTTGNNKYFFSRANSADPGQLNKFRFPDRRFLFERNNNDAAVSGYYTADSVRFKVWPMNIPLVQHTASGAPKGVTDGPLGGPGVATVNVEFGDGTETQPKHYLINKYVLV